MSDFDQLERALSTQLREVGAAARPPADAWERFARRLDSAAAATEQLRPQPGADRVDDGDPSQGMEITMRSNEIAPSRRRWPLLGTAAGLIVVVIVGVALAARDSDEPDPPVATVPPPSAPTTPPAPPPVELQGAEGSPGAVGAFATVSAAFEAFNAGDTAGWAIPVSAELNPDPDESGEPLDMDYETARLAAGGRFENGSCDYEPLAADPAPGTEDGEGPIARHLFNCSVTYVDAFTIAAGIDAVEGYSFSVADDGTPVETFNSGPDVEVRSFMISFVNWLDDEHPDLVASIGAAGLPASHPSPEDVPEVLSLLDEFIAASERWPLTSE